MLAFNIYSELDSLRKMANEEWAKLKTHPLYGCDKMG